MNKKIFLFICLAYGLFACGSNHTEGPPKTPDSPEQVESVDLNAEKELLNDPIKLATDSVLGILNRYYTALEEEQIDETIFFAPTVEKFYNQTNQEREKIGQSIRNGFKGVEDRSIKLDDNSLALKTTNTGFVAEFEGEVSFTRSNDKSKVQEKFRNSVGFNRDFQIVSYEALEVEDAGTARRMAPAARDAIAAEAVLQALATGDKDVISKLVHPELGFYYITRPGAMSSVQKCSSIEEVINNPLTPYSQDRFKKMNCELQTESLPEFDCETFSKEGCFMAEISAYKEISELMKNLKAADLGNYSPDDLSKAMQLEVVVNRKVVATDAVTALYLGEIDGRWYLLAIDTASYDCSA